MKFPVTIRHRNSKAKIYRPAVKFRYYRVAYSAAGKRQLRTFANYSDAKTAAERLVREVSSGSQAATLSAAQSRDAIAAFERLQGFFQASGRRVSLLAAVSEFAEACGKIGGRTLGEAVDGYPFRLILGGDEVLKIMQFLGETLTYSNFKDTVNSTPDQRDKHSIYGQVWHLLLDKFGGYGKNVSEHQK